jgi:hypothetical protein
MVAPGKKSVFSLQFQLKQLKKQYADLEDNLEHTIDDVATLMQVSRNLENTIDDMASLMQVRQNFEHTIDDMATLMQVRQNFEHTIDDMATLMQVNFSRGFFRRKKHPRKLLR